MSTLFRERQVLRPAQLNALARDLLEGSFPQVWVEGEIGNCSRPASGHLYFTLKDERAQVRCALFKPKAQLLRFLPRDGVQVLARGRLTLYEARGDYQLILDHLEEAGEGALRRALETLKAKLAAEGLFDTARKRPVPGFIQRLGVITSPSGAAVRDVLTVLSRRFPLLEVEILPVPVQGDGAAAQIKAMLERAGGSGRFDALLLTRGGGSLEDLWAFNDEALARAIAACPVLVVSAVGHEIDSSLSDFVADLRAATPSAAAELLVPEQQALRARLQHAQAALARHWQRQLSARAQRCDLAVLRLQNLHPQQRLQRGRERLQRLQLALLASQSQALNRLQTRLNAVRERLQRQHPSERLHAARLRLSLLGQRQQQGLLQLLPARRHQLSALARALATISPLATLGRGYALLQQDDGRVVRSAAQVNAGERLQARLAEGQLQLRVEDSAGSR